jgi:hypothetical protein
MKKLLFAVSALAALALLAPSTGFAQVHVYSNQLGLYTTADGHGSTGVADIGAATFVYLVLTKPTDVENGEAAYPSVNAFECTLAFDPVPNNNLFMLNAALPPNNVDVGLRKNINEGFLDYVVGIDVNNPVIVADEAATLITFTFMNMSPAGFTVKLTPTEKPAIAGEMAYQGVQGELRIMYPSSGDHGNPVFQFGDPVVAVENESFGSVKALFR